ncbi:MAG TPA: CHAD domain-containing protein [Aggregatilineales bacterium]|nr:CHAD domain-containing protein [Aggregatilineales bacterium]
MALSTLERIEQLQPAIANLEATDSMADAGRKVLLSELIRMLKHEEGSRLGEDPEEVHDMRVAIRRMRSVFRLLKPYFKAKDVRRFNGELQQLAWALGDVRDLDVFLADLHTFQEQVSAEQQADLQTVIDDLEAQRSEARERLVETLDSKAYRRFVKDFSNFLMEAPKASKETDKDSVEPVQVRHLLPPTVYNRLAAVRAYESALEEPSATTLHSLRIEFKRLRYTVSLFEGVLGTQIEGFIGDLKDLQDILGNLNDIATARGRLEGYQGEGVEAYLAWLDSSEAELSGRFSEAWSRFNSRKVQQKLSNAVLGIR